MPPSLASFCTTSCSAPCSVQQYHLRPQSPHPPHPLPPFTTAYPSDLLLQGIAAHSAITARLGLSSFVSPRPLAYPISVEDRHVWDVSARGNPLARWRHHRNVVSVCRPLCRFEGAASTRSGLHLHRRLLQLCLLHILHCGTSQQPRYVIVLSSLHP